jgi:hypothetical protein
MSFSSELSVHYGLTGDAGACAPPPTCFACGQVACVCDVLSPFVPGEGMDWDAPALVAGVERCADVVA